jgi:hypothetical protein
MYAETLSLRVATRMSEERVGLTYIGIGQVLGYIVGLLTFVGAYIYCIATYGFLLGLGLGWIPASIVAAIVGYLTVVLWGPALLAAVIITYKILTSSG